MEAERPAEARLVAPRTWFVAAFGNVAAFETDDGLVLVDTSSRRAGAGVRAALRGVTQAPLRAVVLTHGHLDHAMGLAVWLEAGDRPQVVAHEGLPRRFRRYARTAGLNQHLNHIQFGLPTRGTWPREFPVVETTYRDSLTLALGGESFELAHARGETDDATW